MEIKLVAQAISLPEKLRQESSINLHGLGNNWDPFTPPCLLHFTNQFTRSEVNKQPTL